MKWVVLADGNVALTVDVDELVLLNNSINEALELPTSEFDERMGWQRSKAQQWFLGFRRVFAALRPQEDYQSGEETFHQDKSKGRSDPALRGAVLADGGIILVVDRDELMLLHNCVAGALELHTSEYHSRTGWQPDEGSRRLAQFREVLAALDCPPE